MINNIRTQQKTNNENAKLSDIFYDEKTKITENLIKETQILVDCRKKDDLIIEKNQKGPYTTHNDDDYLRLINNTRKQQKTNYENAKISDIFSDEKTKITENLIKETQILDPVLHKVKMWKKHNNKPHSVTIEIRGNKGLFAYFRKFKSITVDENSGIIKIVINIHKKSIQRICLPLTRLLYAFYSNHCIDLVGHTGLEKTKEI